VRQQEWLRLRGRHAKVVNTFLERLDSGAIRDLYASITALRSPRISYALSSAAEKLAAHVAVRCCMCGRACECARVHACVGAGECVAVWV